ncbi:MAG TPA: D-alanyl-lipoteichoic acid biosynthesis protein DltD [Candidatus Udaeobacter sp.]|nr:D-alanyl-lipoteichoic acid biosynthesis protein DltD [Candidatus Udaeobacter sp.]
MTSATKQMPHAFAALLALGLAAITLFAAHRVLIHLEHATIASTAPEIFALKNQGLVFQRAAAHSPNVLPIYGSSELLRPAAPERGSVFFRTAPTGFQLSPVGGGGANPLIMLQKVGALGSALHSKRLAFSLSPGWFCTAKPGTQGYKGNFSAMAATEMVFGTALDLGLKREIAKRMLQFPETLEQRPFLEFALKRLASGQLLDRVVFCALWPAGRIQTALYELEDHWAALHHIRRQTKPPPRLQVETVDWPQFVAKASKAKPEDTAMIQELSAIDRKITAGSRDAGFLYGVKVSPAWIDLDLLLRCLASVHARPLILSMPLGGYFYDHAGISRSARDEFYRKLPVLVEQYHFPVVEFQEHDEDPAFLIRQTPHLTAKGWAYYDRALDDFFHGRLPRR